MSINVAKADGHVERFQPGKIKRTLRRARASREVSERIIKEIKTRVYDGITTKEILRLVKSLLRKEEARAAMRYDLKGAMIRLGPAGFPFETFVAKVLEHYGYKTRLRSILQGRCVRHEVDIIAEKASDERIKRYLIECKYYNTPGTFIGLKDALYTYARFLDLNEASELGKGKRFDGVWLACNTRASYSARRYADCKGIKLLGWLHPKGQGLERLVDRKKLYPVTILPSVDKKALGNMSKADLMLVEDLMIHDLDSLREKTGLSKEKLGKIIKEAKDFMSGAAVGGSEDFKERRTVI